MHLEISDKLLKPTVPSSTLHNSHIHCTHLPIPLCSLVWCIGPIILIIKVSALGSRTGNNE